ncbi:hypothetical protein NC651_005114 [Populus alba x Populus x berolinensis]|nr:hypothetical protein NC651_005114 [Populus alba x Populus x berolinensis]
MYNRVAQEPNQVVACTHYLARWYCLGRRCSGLDVACEGKGIGIFITFPRHQYNTCDYNASIFTNLKIPRSRRSVQQKIVFILHFESYILGTQNFVQDSFQSY